MNRLGLVTGFHRSRVFFTRRSFIGISESQPHRTHIKPDAAVSIINKQDEHLCKRLILESDAVLEKIATYLVRCKALFLRGVWGSQHSNMISPELPSLVYRE